jgi:5-methylcytosine-specific restriction protein B
LLKLGEFCIESGKVEKIENDIFGVEEFDCNQAFVKYPVSLEKLIRMYKGAVENGFASYAEA